MTNSVYEPISNALVTHSMRNAKFDVIYAMCSKCLFDVNHDICFIDYMNDVNVRSKSQSKRNKKRKVWKPTGKTLSQSVITSQHASIPVIDDEEALVLEEVSRSTMLAKQNNPISKENKVNTTPINYVELNRLFEDFGKRFVPQKELFNEQAFWLQTSHPNTDQSASSPVKIKAPKVTLVNTSLKNPRYLLGQFNTVVKKRITPDAITEGMQRSESCDKCFDLDAKLLKSQNTYNDLSKSYSQLEKHFISLELTMQLNKENFQKDSFSNNQNALEIPEYFENNNLKAQLQAKDTTICKLKEHIKYKRENDKEEKVKHEMDEIETINIELEHSTRALSKEHCDSLIAQLNSKSVENADLKGQVQEKVFVTTTLQSKLTRLKGKHVLDNATTIINATTIAPGMFKLDIEPISHRLKNNRDPHEACPALPKPSEKLFVVTPLNKDKKVSNALVTHSMRNAKFDVIYAMCSKCLFDVNHDICFIDYMNDVNVRSKSQSKRNKKRKVWKPTGKETTITPIITPSSELRVYSRKPKASRSVRSSSKDKIVESKSSNTKEPKQSWGSTVFDVPSSFLIYCSKFLGTVRFGNNHIAKIMGYGYYQMGNVKISQ
nr:hypothetical protein [Tanacetum cinerariifolium]